MKSTHKNRASGVLSGEVSHPAFPSSKAPLEQHYTPRMKQKAPWHLSYKSLFVPCSSWPRAAPLWGQTLPSGSWEEGADFPCWLQEALFWVHGRKWVSKWVFLVFYLLVGVHFCCSNPQPGNRGLGHCDIFNHEGQNRWTRPSGDISVLNFRKK